MTEFAKAAGTQIAYDTSGEGPDLVFLHAGIADRTMWRPQLEALSDRFRCTAFDARGFGGSALGDQPFSRRDDLAAVLDALGASSASLIGCSIGAGFALDFAIERPERVEALVLSGVVPAGFDYHDPVDEAVYEEVDKAIAAGDYDKAAALEVGLWVDGPRRDEGAAPDWLRDMVHGWCVRIAQISEWGESAQLDPKAASRLNEVTAPTLVIVGKDDLDGILEGCRATAEGIAGGRLVELEGTAHLPSLEVMNEFNKVLVEFLEGSIHRD